jgi:hypothetical protein
MNASKSEMERIAVAAATHAWSVVVVPAPAGIMATRDSGRIGEPWVVMAIPGGRGMRVSLYRPGDDLGADGDVVGELIGNPRETGRQLRSLLEDLAEGDAA